MTDDKIVGVNVDHKGEPLPEEVRRHLDRQRKHQSQPIPNDRPSLDQMMNAPAVRRARLMKAAIERGDATAVARIQAMTDDEIVATKEA